MEDLGVAGPAVAGGFLDGRRSRGGLFIAGGQDGGHDHGGADCNEKEDGEEAAATRKGSGFRTHGRRG